MHITSFSEEFLSRFWAKVDKTPGLGPNGECWEWRGALMGNHNPTYGQVRLGKQILRTHRVAYLIHYQVPIKSIIRHICNNSVCCRGIHLVDGTHSQNMDDMFENFRHLTQRQTKKIEAEQLVKQLTAMEREILLNALLLAKTFSSQR